jgi:hypothetical protein
MSAFCGVCGGPRIYEFRVDLGVGCVGLPIESDRLVHRFLMRLRPQGNQVIVRLILPIEVRSRGPTISHTPGIGPRVSPLGGCSFRPIRPNSALPSPSSREFGFLRRMHSKSFFRPVRAFSDPGGIENPKSWKGGA